MVLHTASGHSSKSLDTVLPLDPARSGRESWVDSVRLSLTIIQYTAHIILISKTQPQQAKKKKKKKKKNIYIYIYIYIYMAMGERRSSRWGNPGSCSCRPVHKRLDTMILFTKGTELTIFGQLKILMMFSINLNLKTFRLLNCLHMIFLHCILRYLIIL